MNIFKKGSKPQDQKKFGTELYALSYNFNMFDSVEVIGIADTHIGSSNYREDKLKAIIKYVLEKENRFAILNGDLCNFGIQQMSGDKDRMTRDDQLFQVVKTFKPLAKENRILSICPGNHEIRMDRGDFYAGRLIARQLGVIDRYRRDGNYVRIHVGKNGHGRPSSYFLYHSHGSGGGRNSGSHMDALKRRGEYREGIDIYIGSHFHEAQVSTECKHFIDKNTCKLCTRTEYYVSTGAFVGYEEYAERAAMRPNSFDQSFITLEGRSKKISIEIKEV